jgi:intracellular sulfur oxidation DsrE/DsrF family protein
LTVDAVLHLDTDHLFLLEKVATTCERLVAGGVRVVVIATDEGVRAFKLPPQSRERALGRLAQLVHAGLTVVVCEASSQQDGIFPGTFAPFVRSTPVGVVEIARLQSQGSAYLTVTSSGR